jgi:methionyl-tRNA formyltransferase
MKELKNLERRNTMFKKITKKDKRTNLEKEIDSVLKKMSTYMPDSTEYTAMATNLERLYKAKANEKERSCIVSPDTIAIIAGNLLGIVLILGYEKTDTITSKALGFIIRGRV